MKEILDKVKCHRTLKSPHGASDWSPLVGKHLNRHQQSNVTRMLINNSINTETPFTYWYAGMEGRTSQLYWCRKLRRVAEQNHKCPIKRGEERHIPAPLLSNWEQFYLFHFFHIYRDIFLFVCFGQTLEVRWRKVHSVGEVKCAGQQAGGSRSAREQRRHGYWWGRRKWIKKSFTEQSLFSATPQEFLHLLQQQ